jgi:transcriptional regulator with GAF, ATPase, and Fis domain
MTNDDGAKTARLEFETLMVETSADLIRANADHVDAAVESALERVRQFFDVDRAGLLRVSDNGRDVSLSHAAYGPDIPKVPTTVDLAKLFPWCHQLLVRERRPVIVDRLADLPPEAAVDRDTWTRFGARSNVSVPVVSGGTVTHVLSLGALGRERQWPTDFIPRLTLLGEMCVGAVVRAQMLHDLERAVEEVNRLQEHNEQENVYLRREIAGREASSQIIGRSRPMRDALALASQVAATDSTVLITGETGTGKERFATFIHEQSARRVRHMVRVNCSAIPSALIESELFGREKGAYTGALSRQIGRFELAQRSTLFLDEIGDLPTDVQVKLLRVIQERTIERLGSPTPIPIDVRIIVATNHDLEAAVRAGTFRSDLFYRLNVFPIEVPPLRERGEDIALLIDALVEELGAATSKRFTAVHRASLEALCHYDWPGNVRELRNVLERAMILCAGPTLTVDVPRLKRRSTVVSPASPASAPVTGGLRKWERERILQVLSDTGWRIRGTHGAAEVLGLKPTTLEKRMAKLGIERPSRSAAADAPQSRLGG